jgi:hypothetical protein
MIKFFIFLFFLKNIYFLKKKEGKKKTLGVTTLGYQVVAQPPHGELD